MADPIESFLADYEQNETLHIPEQRLTCCCGNEACAYLRHNQSALDGLERDVSNAARLGKALLIRHEAYISDSEPERKAMAEHIESLEADKQTLEKRNATMIEENRDLLDQLEALNSAVADSDAHVMSLQATLTSTQQEFQKLTQLASRTERLEQQIVDFEREQATWHTSFETKEESEKSAVRRWQKAERTLASLQEQMERIEQEAKEEKERHADIVGRMERRHAVEKELNSAAGRLKGAAASKAGETDGAGPNVVSHFVKDILQDNANLQMGIVELREMLNNSNEEVEDLRSRLTLHQPADEDDDTPKANHSRKDLNIEMNRANSSELHVHHHYHAPAPPTPKAQALRRPKKKRIGAFGQGYSTPNSGTSTPRSSFSYATPTSTAAILQQTAASLPQPVPARKRLSTQSSQTYHSMVASSGPSSPQSTTNPTSSIFDRVFSDAGDESSRPTTPDTEHPGSPILGPGNSKRSSGTWTRTYSAPLVQCQSCVPTVVKPTLDSIRSIEELPKLETPVDTHDIIHEEDEAEWDEDSLKALEEDSSVASPMSDKVWQQETPYRPILRKAASHESLLSVSGMDIHTLRSRPSQLLAPYAGRAMASKASIGNTTAYSAQPVVAMSRAFGDSRNLLTGMAAEKRQPPKPTLGKKVGGWMFGRWGATPAPATTAVTTSMLANKPASVSTSNSVKTATDTQATPKKPKLRPAGINQGGPLLGFFPETPRREVLPPRMNSLDQDALKNALDGI